MKEDNLLKSKTSVKTAIIPWLSVKNSRRAVAFYKAAFNAVEVYHIDGEDDSVVSRLSVEGAEFWVSEGAGKQTDDKEPAVRMIFNYADPDTLFKQVIEAGATEIFPVGEDFGWRLGRLADPFGIHWEIGYEL